ncbi:MAG: hypothetical protein QM736_14805 [Vicinamibacterales bacterium]
MTGGVAVRTTSILLTGSTSGVATGGASSAAFDAAGSATRQKPALRIAVNEAALDLAEGIEHARFGQCGART